MPLRLPDKLPAIELLKHENIFVMDYSRAHMQDIRPLKMVILNLMPLKITTETDLIRLLSNTPLQIEVNFMKLKSHTPKNTPIEHMMMFYRDFEAMKDEKFDGMIITGAPVESLDFEQVTYWDEMQRIFAWARPTSPVRSTSAGLPRPDFTIITAYRSIRSRRRCLASSASARSCRSSPFSVVSTTCSTCRTAAIRRFGVRMFLRIRSCSSLLIPTTVA